MISMIQSHAQTKSSCSGLTFVELLIAMVAMTIIMGGLTAVFISQSRMSVSEEELIDLQMNLRVATDRLAHALSHAGFGCYDTFKEGYTISGNEPGGSQISINSHVYDIDNNTSSATSINSDSLVIVYGFRSIGTASSIISNVVKLDNSPSPEPDEHKEKFKNYFYFYPNTEGSYVYVLSDYDETDLELVFDTEIRASDGANVFMVSPTRIQIVDVVRKDRFGKDINTPTLYFKNFSYTSSQYWIVAENIEDMQIQYSLDGNIWQDEVASSGMKNIRMIRFWLLGKSQNPVKDTESRVFEITEATDRIDDPNNMCIDGFTVGDEECVIYRVGPFNDGHLRMLSRSEVVLRNAL